jgi:hypothetical protein
MSIALVQCISEDQELMKRENAVASEKNVKSHEQSIGVIRPWNSTTVDDVNFNVILFIRGWPSK